MDSMRHIVRLAAPVVVLIAAETSASPARYEIAFASFAPLNTDIFIADGDGNNARPLLPHPEADANASFSSDGKWIVFTSRRAGSSDIYRVRSDGSGLQRLVKHAAYDDQAALSPDGRTLAFVSSRSGNADVWLLDLQSRAARNLTRSPGGDFRPAWSPDGQRIAFSSDRESLKPRQPARDFTIRHSTEIHVINIDGTGLQRLSIDNAFAGSPAWSPDGARLAFYTATIPEVAKVTGARWLRRRDSHSAIRAALVALRIGRLFSRL